VSTFDPTPEEIAEARQSLDDWHADTAVAELPAHILGAVHSCLDGAAWAAERGDLEHRDALVRRARAWIAVWGERGAV
jgi:hypothetical protein